MKSWERIKTFIQSAVMTYETEPNKVINVTLLRLTCKPTKTTEWVPPAEGPRTPRRHNTLV